MAHPVFDNDIFDRGIFDVGADVDRKAMMNTRVRRHSRRGNGTDYGMQIINGELVPRGWPNGR